MGGFLPKAVDSDEEEIDAAPLTTSLAAQPTSSKKYGKAVLTNSTRAFSLQRLDKKLNHALVRQYIHLLG